jgi:hypothetical protein
MNSSALAVGMFSYHALYVMVQTAAVAAAQYYKTVNSTSWEVIISEPPHLINAFQYQNTTWPIDRKWVLAGQRASGPLVLQFTVERVAAADAEQPVMLCRQLPADHTEAEKQLQPEAALDNVSIFLNGEVSERCLLTAEAQCCRLAVTVLHMMLSLIMQRLVALMSTHCYSHSSVRSSQCAALRLPHCLGYAVLCALTTPEFDCVPAVTVHPTTTECHSNQQPSSQSYMLDTE